jgi:hypothetical protein
MIVIWDGDFPEMKRASIDVVERCRILGLDGFLEGADGLCARDLDGKYVAWIITMDETVEFEIGRRGWMGYWLFTGMSRRERLRQWMKLTYIRTLHDDVKVLVG